MAKSLPRKVKVGFRVAMASQPFDFIIPYEVIVSIHCRQHCCIHHHHHHHHLRRRFYRGFQNLSERTKSQQSHHDLIKILHIRIFILHCVRF